MSTIHIGISHNDDMVIPCLLDIKWFTDTSPDCWNECLNFIVFQDLMDSCLFNVQDLTTKGKNRLEPSVPPLFGTTTCRVSFHDVYLTLLCRTLRAVGKFPWKSGWFKGALSSRKFFCFPCCFSGLICQYCLINNRGQIFWMFFKIFTKRSVDQWINNAFDLTVS